MKKQFFLFALFCAALLTISCTEDKPYPSLISDFVCVQTDRAGSLQYLLTDEGTTYSVELSDSYTQKHDSLPTYAADSIYRVVAMYEPDVENNSCILYDISTIYSKAPFAPSEDIIPAYDPVFLQSIRKSGNYLNIILQLFSLNGKHHLGVLDTTEEGKAGIDLTLIHKSVDDVESYRQRIYMSIPLEKCDLSSGDTIRFHANLYNEGMKTWTFIY